MAGGNQDLKSLLLYITLYTAEKGPGLQKPRMHNKAGKTDLFEKI